jgi:hypothetical protein
MNGKTINKATFRQKLKLYELLKEFLKVNEDGTAEYIEGMNDEAIAKRVEGATASHVANIRRAEFGNFPTQQRGNVATLQARIEQLETAVANLIKCNHDLAQKHDTLCKTLALNKVADVRHLATTHRDNGAGVVATHVGR